jgi:type II secretory pathway pseudopilin PulG
MSRKKNRAFSLIEISVVIVIVMIMIAGLMQASRVIGNMRITTARNVTQSSAMPWINYIVTWYDATAADAFSESENNDGNKISRWNGAEIRYSDRINITQVDDAKKPIFVSNGMYGLPSIKFDGVDDYFASEQIEQSILTYRSGAVFIVFEPKTTSTAAKRSIFYQPAECGREFDIGYGFGGLAGNFGLASSSEGDCGSTNATTSSLNYVVPNEKIVVSMNIYQAPMTKGDISNIKIYRNGYLETISKVGDGYNSALIESTKKYADGSNRIYVGARKTSDSANPSSFFEGLLGEMIVFNRSLNNEDRKEIEKYLGKKWGIKVNYEQ